MQTKKTVISVILGVAMVALAIATVTRLVSAMTTFTDTDALGMEFDYYYVELAVFGLLCAFGGIALLLLFALIRKKRKFAIVLTSSIVLAFAVISVVILRATIPSGSYGNIDRSNYAQYSAYLSTCITFIISAFFVCICGVLLDKENAAAPAVAAPVDTASANVVAPSQSSASAESVAPSAPVESDDKNLFCTQCGTENRPNSRFCTKCGHELN